MKLSEITLEMVKSYLSIDHDVDDTRLKMHMESALSLILKVNGQKSLTSDFEDSNDFLTDVYYKYIQNLYDYGTMPESSYLNSILTMDRNFDD